MHERRMHPDDTSHFLTLTLDDSNLTVSPLTGCLTLNPRDLELFWKRLRKNIGPFRYYACGEYGDTTGRPHYHAILFGLPITDKKHYTTKNDIPLYTSDTIQKEWKLGQIWLGDVTFESCAYVARYVMKKFFGNWAELYDVEDIYPEFSRMSRRPGIGSTWYDKYKSDLFPSDECVIRGNTSITPPLYYTKKLALENPTQYLHLKKQREKKALKNSPQNTPHSRAMKKEVKLKQLETLLRSLPGH